MKDYHGILRVRKGASPAEIRRAYRKLAMQYHPDRNGEPGAGEKFKEISEAYAVLSGKEKPPQEMPATQTRGQGRETGGGRWAGGRERTGQEVDAGWERRVINIWQGIMQEERNNMYR